MKGLLFISHETPKYTTLDSIKIALKGGCKHIQLRMKNYSVEEIDKVGRIALTLCKNYKAKLYIDDQVTVCKALRADGVHLGKKDIPPSEARKKLGEAYIIGGTANTWEDIVYLKNEGVNYIGLGPFKYTKTKKKLAPLLGLKGYKRILSQIRTSKLNIPLFAIGGITVEDIPPLLQLGVSGIALSSTILQAQNPIEETQKIINIIQKHRS